MPVHVLCGGYPLDTISHSEPIILHRAHSCFCQVFGYFSHQPHILLLLSLARSRSRSLSLLNLSCLFVVFNVRRILQLTGPWGNNFRVHGANRAFGMERGIAYINFDTKRGSLASLRDRYVNCYQVFFLQANLPFFSSTPATHLHSSFFASKSFMLAFQNCSVQIISSCIPILLRPNHVCLHSSIVASKSCTVAFQYCSVQMLPHAAAKYAATHLSHTCHTRFFDR